MPLGIVISLQFTPLSGEYLSLFLVSLIFTTGSHAKNLSSFKVKTYSSFRFKG